MKLLTSALIALALLWQAPAALAVTSPPGPPSVSTSSYSRPPVGTRVVVTQATTSRPAVTAKVPPAQTTGARVPASRTVKTYGTPYSPSGYTTASGRAAAYSPVSRSYVEVHHYWYSGWPMFAGYYGCLYCFSGPYAYAPVPIPFTPAAWTQPTWSYDVEIILLLGLVVLGLLLLGRWWGRRSY